MRAHTFVIAVTSGELLPWLLHESMIPQMTWVSFKMQLHMPMSGITGVTDDDSLCIMSKAQLIGG
jgi:hypothetical protein